MIKGHGGSIGCCGSISGKEGKNSTRTSRGLGSLPGRNIQVETWRESRNEPSAKIRRWGRIQCVCGTGWGVHGGELYKDGLDIDEAREWSNGALGITLKNLQFIQRTMGDTEIKMVP